MFLLRNTLQKHKAFSPELFSIETNRRVQTSQFPTCQAKQNPTATQKISFRFSPCICRSLEGESNISY